MPANPDRAEAVTRKITEFVGRGLSERWVLSYIEDGIAAMIREAYHEDDAIQASWEADKKAWVLRSQSLHAELKQARALLDDALGFLAKERTLLEKAKAALEQLARLGNGDQLGNSDGNMIARRALAELGGGEEGK